MFKIVTEQICHVMMLITMEMDLLRIRVIAMIKMKVFHQMLRILSVMILIKIVMG